MRPLIGIPCATFINVEGRPKGFRVNQSYSRAIAAAGGTPILIPPLGNVDVLRAQFEALDGLLLPGGTDIDPKFYGQAPHPELDVVDPPLDEAELTLTRWALAEGMPVLGICRGQQTLNVAAGGSLFQHIPDDITQPLTHSFDQRNFLGHTISVDPGSRLADIFGMTELAVNSMHHQSVKDVAPGFVIVARSPDAVVEGIERPDHRFAVSVQFHPEELVPDHEASVRLFQRFVEEAARR